MRVVHDAAGRAQHALGRRLGRRRDAAPDELLHVPQLDARHDLWAAGLRAGRPPRERDDADVRHCCVARGRVAQDVRRLDQQRGDRVRERALQGAKHGRRRAWRAAHRAVEGCCRGGRRGGWRIYVPESDVEPLELVLDFRVCNAGTVRAARLAIKRMGEKVNTCTSNKCTVRAGPSSPV